MPFDPSETALRDILHHIRLVAEFVAGVEQNYAVTRCLEIISEASRRLPDELKARHPTIAWNQMAGAGNVYRHEYEDVVAEIVWETVQLDLPALQTTVEQELARLV